MIEQPLTELELPTNFGFRMGDRGTLTSRTIMLAELMTLLTSKTASANKPDYWSAIIDDNLLGKKTASTRKLTAQRLSELYALDPSVPLFRLFRLFWDMDSVGRQLLALLCACARDPLLRITAGPVLQVHQGEIVTKKQFEDTVAGHTGDRFNPSILNKIARNAASSWTQSGHLSGRKVKIRTRPNVTPANTAYALLLGFLCGARGLMLFRTFWASLLDAPEHILYEMAKEASSRGWLTYRGIGNIVEVDFSYILTPTEKGMVDG